MASFTGTIPTPDDCFTLKVEYTPSWGSNYDTVKLSNVTGYVKRNKSTVYPYTTTGISTLTVNGSSTKKTGVTYNLNDDDYDQITDANSYTIYMTSDGTSSGTKVSSKSFVVQLAFDGNLSNYYPIGSVSKTLTYTRASYTISYNANGGSGAPSSQTKYAGMSLTLSSTKPTRSNSTTTYTATLNANGGNCSTTSLSGSKVISYTFNKWNTVSDGSGTSYSTGSSYTANAATTLYAQWSSSTSNATISLPTPTRTGYTFKGWSTSSTATSGSTGNYTLTSNVTLYAIWSANTYTVTYNSNGGSGSMSSDTATYNSSYVTKANGFSRTGYTFKGWNEKSDGSGTDWTSYIGKSWTWTYTKNVTLYAIWQANTYTLTLKGNKGNPDTQSLTLTYDSSNCSQIQSYLPTRSGCQFLGWFTSEENGTQVYNAQGVCTNEGTYWKNSKYVYVGNLTLYAQWKILNVAYYNNNGTYVLCNTYGKVNNTWQPMLVYGKINGEWVRSIVDE